MGLDMLRHVTDSNNTEEVLLLKTKAQEEEILLDNIFSDVEILKRSIFEKDQQISKYKIIEQSLLSELSEKEIKQQAKIKKLENSIKQVEEKCLVFYQFLEELIEEKRELIEDKKNDAKKINMLTVENYRYKEYIEDLKHHFSYTLGNAILSTKFNMKDLINMPKKVLLSYKDFYDYKLIKSKIKNSITMLDEDLMKGGILKEKIIPLRLKTVEINFTKKDLELASSLSIYPYTTKYLGENELTCEVLIASGSVTIRNLVNNEEYNLRKGQSIKKIFLVKDKLNTKIFEFSNYTYDVKITVIFSKKTGKALLLEINKDHEYFLDTNINLNQKKIDNQNSLLYKIPKNPEKNPLWNALNILNEHGYDLAIEYCEKYCVAHNKAAINILKANANYNNEDLWLKYVNNYLSKYGLEPIFLNLNKKNERYFRIDCEVKKRKVVDDVLISIIMPAFNAEKTIEKAINSILGQTWRNIELIVVNDCSTDNTQRILDGINDSRLKVIKNIKNVGAYVSKNIALKVATGTYITGHDSDDWAHPSRLENHMTAIKENGFPKASITRMIRMDKTGFFSHIGKEGAFSVDGVMRIASITCMFESDFLKKNLGGWDSVRFGADSEIIARATKILGKNFKNFEQISMICLDAEGSLTNDPIHGVSKETGISPTRKEYRDAWMAWHETLDTNNMYLEFPHQKRKFAVPNAAFVSTEDINANLETMILSN